MNIVLFADNYVGLKCIEFVIKTYINDIAYIVITDKNSLVYEYLDLIKFDQNKILIYSDSIHNILIKDKVQFDYFLLLWWPFILKQEVFSIPRFGSINTHPSLLPFNRGKHYNFWNIFEDVPFGVSLHFIDQGIDSGDVIFQKKIDKSWEDNGKTLYNKAQNAMIELFEDSYFKLVNMEYIRQKQNIQSGSFHHAKELEFASEIHLEKKYTAKELLNVLRARTFTGNPSCWFEEEGEVYEVRIEIKKRLNDTK